MKAMDLKAILVQTSEFAVRRIPIDAGTNWNSYTYRNDNNLRSCPTGLKKAKVIGTGKKWEEKFTLGCGDTEHTRVRRNGVLIEFPLPDKAPKPQKGRRPTASAYWRAKSQTEIITRDGAKFVRMVVDARAIVAPWGEYALIEAERQKASEAHQARQERKKATAEALGVESCWQERYAIDEMGEPVEVPADESRRDYFADCILIPIGQAERIAGLIAKGK